MTNSDTGSVTKVMESAAADVMNAAGKKYDETLTAVASQASKTKDAVAGETKNVAEVLRRASRDLEHGSIEERTIGMLANGLADVSDALREKDIGEMLQSANKTARENPLMFLGGAVLLGFAVSRFAKATSDLPPHLLTKKARDDHDIRKFVDEGNPNTEPVEVE